MRATSRRPSEGNLTIELDGRESALVATGRIFRRRRRTGDEFSIQEPRAPGKRPARVARMLAFAHQLARNLEHGDFSSQAEAATHLQLTRARVTQLLNLTLLAPDIQERLLALETSGAEPLTARQLRHVASVQDWHRQRQLWREGGWAEA